MRVSRCRVRSPWAWCGTVFLVLLLSPGPAGAANPWDWAADFTESSSRELVELHEELLAVASEVPVRTEVQVFSLEQGNEALTRLRDGRLTGAAVLKM